MILKHFVFGLAFYVFQTAVSSGSIEKIAPILEMSLASFTSCSNCLEREDPFLFPRVDLNERRPIYLAKRKKNSIPTRYIICAPWLDVRINEHHFIAH